MNTIRPLATIAILAAIGVFLAQQINKAPVATTAGLSGEWDGEPIGEAPAFDAGGDTSATEATPFVPQSADSPTNTPAEMPGDAPSATTPTMPALPDMPAMPTIDPYTADGAPTTELPAAPVAAYPGAAYPDDGANEQAAAPATTPTTPEPGQVTGAVRSLGTATPGYEASPYGAPAQDSAMTQAEPASPPTADYGAGPSLGDPSTSAAVPPPNFDDNTGPAAPPQASVPTPSGFATARPAIEAALARDELARAHLLLSQWYGDPSLSSEERREVDTLLSQLAGTVIYSTDHRLEPPHQVQPGETLESIAQKYQVPWRLLAKINGVPRADAVEPGQILKVIRGPFKAVVDLSDSEVALEVDGRYAGRYAVEIAGVEESASTLKVERKLLESTSSSPYESPVTKPRVVVSGGGAPIEIVPLTGEPTQSTSPRISVAASEMGDLFDILSEGSEVVVRK